MALETVGKRGAALGYSTLGLVLPDAAGAISVPSAGHALGAYVWDYEDSDIVIRRVAVTGRYRRTLSLVGRLT
jgi:hypothetical protein